MITSDANAQPSTLPPPDHRIAEAQEALGLCGYAVFENVLEPGYVASLRERMYAVQARIVADIGQERLDRAGELGILRLMMHYDPFFFSLLEIPLVLQLVDATVSPTAILHLMNGFILPSAASDQIARSFQGSFHRDFPRMMNGYVASVNVLVAVDDFTPENGATLVVPGTQHKEPAPGADYARAHQLPLTCPAGSVIVFDSTLVHAAGPNTSPADRLAINMQFTRSFIKQQIDYVRALGEAVVAAQAPRTQQLLGYFTRVVTSLDEYYRPAHERLYRPGQG